MSLLLTYYGDDFTGSTDAMEALAANGVRAILFLGVPDSDQLERFQGYDAIGIAGESRSRNPQWMRESLPDVFGFLKSLGAPMTQYKVCSTFDSSPEIGNIGVAMNVGRDTFGSQYVPVVVAAPHLRRYVLFGNLFAGQGDAVYRIDRHLTMSRHPVTPMRESDLRLHLKEQTGQMAELFDLPAITSSNPGEALDRLLARVPQTVIFDGLDERTELSTGGMLWERRARNPFVVGSSGLTLGLMRHWREAGLISQQFAPPAATPTDRVIVMSGSCSPVTESQIRFVLNDGFEGFRSGAAEGALDALSRGKSVVIYSALGPQNLNGGFAGEDLGRYLGGLLLDLVRRSGVRRVVIAGGDTSSHAVNQLGVRALTFAASLAPGVPLCRAHSDDPTLDGLELALKGGQVGGIDFFRKTMKGH